MRVDPDKSGQATHRASYFITDTNQGGEDPAVTEKYCKFKQQKSLICTTITKG